VERGWAELGVRVGAGGAGTGGLGASEEVGESGEPSRRRRGSDDSPERALISSDELILVAPVTESLLSV